MGVKIEANEISVVSSINIEDDNGNNIGELRSGVYSPHFKKVIGIAMLKKPYWKISQSIKIKIENEYCIGDVCELPFI